MITIKPITDHELYEVNGKEVYNDTNGNYISRVPFTVKEMSAFSNYKAIIIQNPNIKKHTRAIYKG